MATDEERESWQTDPDAAYAEAERRVAEVRRTGAVRLNLNSDAGNDEALPALAHLPSLHDLPSVTWIDLNNTQVTDIKPIAQCQNLQTLRLSNTQVTNIAPLTQCRNLQTLNLANTQVTDITPIGQCRSLQSLYLDKTRVTDIMPIHELAELAEAASEHSFRGLEYADTPVAERPVFRDLVALDNPNRTIQTLQYLNGEHPEYGGPPPEAGPLGKRSNRAALLASPPAEIVTRRGTVDLDPAPPGDTPEDAGDQELGTLPRRQQNLADQLRDALGKNQPVTRTALAQYRDELVRPQSEIILEILKEAYLTAKAGIEQATREGALDDDALAAWEQFDANHGVYLAHYPLDAKREHLYRNAPVDMEKADPAAVAAAFDSFCKTLGEDAVAEIVGERLQDWAENSARLSRIVMETAQNAAARGDDGDITEEDMPHRVWLRRQVAQGWVMMVKLKEFLDEKVQDEKFRDNVSFYGSIASLLGFLGMLIL